MKNYTYNDELYHWGVKGMKWSEEALRKRKKKYKYEDVPGHDETPLSKREGYQGYTPSAIAKRYRAIQARNKHMQSYTERDYEHDKAMEEARKRRAEKNDPDKKHHDFMQAKIERLKKKEHDKYETERDRAHSKHHEELRAKRRFNTKIKSDDEDEKTWDAEMGAKAAGQTKLSSTAERKKRMDTVKDKRNHKSVNLKKQNKEKTRKANSKSEGKYKKRQLATVKMKSYKRYRKNRRKLMSRRVRGRKYIGSPIYLEK